MKNIVILISGRGSNMQAIALACAREQWRARIAAVVSNRPDAAGLAFAAAHGIATACVDHQAHASRESFDMALATVIDGFQPDLVVLAGFMRILTPGFVQRYAGRLMNIHPSLLPAFPGLNTHQRAHRGASRRTGAAGRYRGGPVAAGARTGTQNISMRRTLVYRRRSGYRWRRRAPPARCLPNLGNPQ